MPSLSKALQSLQPGPPTALSECHLPGATGPWALRYASSLPLVSGLPTARTQSAAVPAAAHPAACTKHVPQHQSLQRRSFDQQDTPHI